MLFSMKDAKRLSPTGSGSVADRHKQLFPGSGTFADREKIYLVSKGATTGTIGDRWRQVLGTPPGTRIGQSIRGLAALP